MDVTAVKTEMETAARDAAQRFVDEWTRSTGGNQYGEPMYCGFAWVTIEPEHKGNTRAGKAERQLFESLGASKDWTGKTYQIWSPARWRGQSMDVHEAGARAAAEVLKKYGIRAYMGSRAD